MQHYDLDAEPLPHLSANSLAGKDATEAARAERAMKDFLEADILVIGAPNLGDSPREDVEGRRDWWAD